MFGYVFLQLLWWAYQIIELNKIVHHEQSVIHGKTMMIAGEAGVFILLLLVGVYFIRKSILKELVLVNNKKNFMLSVTHELKTPIASSKLFIETLLNRNLPQEKQKDILGKVYTDQERLQHLVEDILLASKLDDHKVTLHLEKTNLLDFIKSVTQHMKDNGREVYYKIPEHIEKSIDRFYFSSVIQNLHSNAIKYSPEDTPIVWEVEKESGKIYIRVKDNGNGIPKAERQDVFTLFYRMGDENTRRTKGTGLGLYLVEKIVKLHQGSIRILANKPSGTCVEIEL